jgi:hypothetical protein
MSSAEDLPPQHADPNVCNVCIGQLIDPPLHLVVQYIGLRFSCEDLPSARSRPEDIWIDIFDTACQLLCAPSDRPFRMQGMKHQRGIFAVNIYVRKQDVKIFGVFWRPKSSTTNTGTTLSNAQVYSACAAGCPVLALYNQVPHQRRWLIAREGVL